MASGYDLEKEAGALDHAEMPNHVKIAVKVAMGSTVAAID